MLDSSSARLLQVMSIDKRGRHGLQSKTYYGSLDFSVQSSDPFTWDKSDHLTWLKIATEAARAALPCPTSKTISNVLGFTCCDLMEIVP